MRQQFISERDPHGLLRKTAQIYKAYYDTGGREYEKAGEQRAVLSRAQRVMEGVTVAIVRAPGGVPIGFSGP